MAIKSFRKDLKKDIIPFLLTVSLVILILGIIQIHNLFEDVSKETIEERDEQLFSLAYSVDNNLKLKLAEVDSELKYVVKREDFVQAEQALVEDGDTKQIASFFKKSHLFEKPSVHGVVALSGGEQCFSLDCHGESHTFTFLDDHDGDPIWICYDEKDQYYIGVEGLSLNYDIQYYALFDLDYFHDAIIPESIRETHWVVFFDEESGMALHNHRNQDPYFIFSEEEIMERNDGYTIILENEKKGTKGSVTYEYANYSGKVVPERLITLPSEQSLNGIFAIGISMDSEKLYQEIERDKRKMIMILIGLLVIFLAIYSFIYQIYAEIERRRYEAVAKQKEEELIDQLADARLKNSISQLQPHFMYNALSSIRELVLDEPEYAADLLYNFTHYLRACVRSISQKEMIPFAEELENIRAYTSIEQMRFGNGLKILYDIQFEEFEVIPLGIQPLVENAIRHGIVKRRGKKGTVWIRSALEGEQIVVAIEDDGVGFDTQKIREEVQSGQRDSTGIHNLIFRFEHLMHATIDIASEPSKGTRVVIRIPNESEGDRHQVTQK